MSAYYDLYETPDPQGDKTEKSLHARIYPKKTYTTKEFLKQVAMFQHLPYAMLEGALQAITDELSELLADGNIVELGELGFLSTSLKCLREATPEKKIRAESIAFSNVNLRTSKIFKKKIRLLMTLERIQSPTRPSKAETSVEKKKEALLLFLDKNICITRREYVKLTGSGERNAVNELNSFIEQGVLRRRGAGRTVVYIKNEHHTNPSNEEKQ